MLTVAWLVPALPLAGFLLLVVFGRRLGEAAAGWLATAACTGAFVVAVGCLLDLASRPQDQRSDVTTLFTWIPVGSLNVELGFLVDPLSMTMMLFVTGIGALIHLYSIGYMHGDPKFSKFFLYLNLFVFSMLMLVMGDNLVVTFLGWEGVGACSYFLISFWQTREAAASAAKKAFVTNRIGDWGFMLAMFLTFQAVGSLNYADLNGAAAGLAGSTATAIAVLLFVGAMGKSAQLPLSVWLPDAMAGPTPVSALIHAATMVTAGVYLLCRVSPLLHEVPNVGTAIAVVGIVTALWAATVAIAQNDIKKVLAYSTVSQLGFMFIAVGSGAYVAAVFHMVTHAFFKALLFLGSGSVIHGVHDEQDMRRMGALRKLMPITYITFMIGFLAIAGIPPFAGFWSKDEILAAAFQKSTPLWVATFVAAGLTAFYMTRQVIMVFFGEARWKHEPVPTLSAAGHDDPEQGHVVTPHESSWLMTLPLVVLAVLATFGGLFNLPFWDGTRRLEHWLDPVLGEAEVPLTLSTSTLIVLALSAVAISLVGIGTGYLVYERRRVRTFEPAVFADGWYLDRSIGRFAGGPGMAAFEGVAWFDSHVVDGAVNGVAGGVRWSAERLRRTQTGFVRNYALGIAVGAVLLLVWFATRGGF